MQDTTAELRHRVREVLRTYPGSQRAFAGEVGLDPTKLSKSLAGTRRFTATELKQIAEVGDVTVNWLINGADDVETVAAIPQRTARVDGSLEGSAEAGRYQQILDAAWTLIAERGFHAVRVSDVARACGTSSATIHYHFPGRDDLLTATLRYAVRLAFDRQVAELHAIADAHERLLRLVELQLPTPGLLRQEWSIWLQVWNESSLNPNLQVLHSDSYARWHDTIARTIREGQQQGVFVERDADALTAALAALVDGLGIQVMTGRPGRSVDGMRELLRDFVERDVVRH
ncbi:TetR family transcriptional regulator C-terminal domain-containing protein [Salinifilum aidingensis]